MKKWAFVLCALLCAWTSPAVSNPTQTITLKDNTVIHGEVLGMQNGVYSVKTATLGTLQIPAQQVIAIIAEEAAPPAPAIRDGRPKTPPAPPQKAAGNRKKAAASDPSSPSTSQEQSSADSKGSNLQQDVNGRVQSMMMNKDFSEKVSGLSENSAMEEVLNDPETMNAIQNGDYNSLMNNEKMQKLMDNPDMQNILGNFEEK